MVPSLLLLSCELSVSVKENLIEKNEFYSLQLARLLKTNSKPNFLKVFWKFRKVSRKKSDMEFLYSKFQACKIQPSVLHVFKAPEHSLDNLCWGTKADTRRFSTGYQLCLTFWKSPRTRATLVNKESTMMFHWYFSVSFWELYFFETLVNKCFRKFKQPVLYA